MMKRLIALLPLLALAGAAPAPTEVGAADVSRALALKFQQELGGALQSAIKEQGTAGAVTACNSIAPAVAQRITEQSGASVRRTALRTRNPGAAPDAHERAAMAELAVAPVDAAGQFAERSGWTGSGPDRRYRYVRAIPTAPMCLSCHGSAIAPDVAAAIAAAYPGDTATGFAPGQMRGAFSISWTPQALAAALAKAQ
ncbi:Tll0287-like domain-containing protein [Sandarakinorhabdus sp.]|uniref:Tll0287-like domain-containing protein n=1 Tax=Sandarakinorhabdus sp. TaxID=1916663 RepID=UPI003F7052B4